MTLSVRQLAVVIICLGIGLRLGEYLANASLDTDEAKTAYRLQSIPLHETFFPKASNYERMQSYPIGFLAAVKACRWLLGDREAALRLFPLLASILSLILFYKFAAYFLKPGWDLAALTLFAISRDIIYFGACLKSYASDMGVAILLTLMMIDIYQKPLTMPKTFLLLGAGILALYFSFPATMLLFPLAGILTLIFLAKKDPKGMKLIGLIMGWGISFVIYYYFSLRHISPDPQLKEFWKSSFFPVSEGISSMYVWLVVVFKRIFGKFLQYPVFLAGLFFILGVIQLAKKDFLRWCLLLVPVFVTIGLSALRLYPFDGRTVFFLFPGIITVVVYGFSALADSVPSLKRVIIGISACFFILMSGFATAQQFLEVSGAEEIKPVLAYLNDRKEQDDIILVYRGSANAFEYYRGRMGIANRSQVITRANVRQVMEDLEGENPKRLWILFSHVGFDPRLNERIFILERLGEYGRKVDAKTVMVRPFSVVPTLENNISASIYLFEWKGRHG